MPVTTINDRDYEITLNGRLVEYLFADGSETFDLTAADEAVVDGELRVISEGDTLGMTVHV